MKRALSLLSASAAVLLSVVPVEAQEKVFPNGKVLVGPNLFSTDSSSLSSLQINTKTSWGSPSRLSFGQTVYQFLDVFVGEYDNGLTYRSYKLHLHGYMGTVFTEGFSSSITSLTKVAENVYNGDFIF
ncbi:MAG: hypothetical protein LBU03_05655 [Tannerellaceae bacterium]|jgi:hypothetical protein|nr:hypothetical protein [Tannerellaceae bacterium]